MERLAILIAAEFAINIGSSGTASAMTRLIGLAFRVKDWPQIW